VPTSQKDALLGLAKYMELANAQFTDLLYRVKIVETALQANPQLLEAYNRAVKDTKRPPLQGLPIQLRAIEQAIGRLSD